MESVGAFPDGEWDSISRMLLNADQGFDYAPQLFGQYPFSHEHDDDSFVISSTFCSPLEANASMAGVTENSFCSLEGLNSSFQYIFQETSLGSGCSSTSVSVPSSSRECYYFSDSSNVPITNSTYMSNDVYMTDENSSPFAIPFPDTSMEESARANERGGQLPPMAVPAKRKFNVPDLNTEGNTNSENPKKKPRAARAVQKSPKSKKTQKVTINNGKDEEESNGAAEGQSSSSCCSEDEITTNNEINRVEPEMAVSPPSTTTVSGKTRASRGSATDPQSLYARKRRERINERLKILQNLVPNGTKVDISTMLEEAVEYVKFLQLQIKLLSSDEMWMYAPIAYNGMDIGLNARMCPTSP